MAILGLRTAENFEAAGTRGIRPENWRQGILLLSPNGDAPLTGLTSAMKSESSDDPRFNWFEKVHADRRLQLAADLNNVVTTFTVVDDGNGGARQFPAGTVLYLEQSGELMLVTTTPSVATTFPAVTRGFAGTTPEALISVATENPFLFSVGTAFEEGSNAPMGVNYDPTEKFNYTQIFRNTLEATMTAVNTRLRTGDAVREAKREALLYHGTDMERAFWFNTRTLTTFNQRPQRVTEGFFAFMTREQPTRVVTLTAPITYDELEDQFRLIFKYGSQEKMAFLGDLAMLVVQRTIRYSKNANMDISPMTKEFGMNVRRVFSPFGTLVLKTHPLWNRLLSAGTYSSIDSWMAVIDMDEVRYRYLKSRDTHYESGLETNDQDAMKGGYLTECGIEWHHARSHYVLKGLTSAGAEA